MGRKMSETCFKMQVIHTAGFLEPHWRSWLQISLQALVPGTAQEESDERASPPNCWVLDLQTASLPDVEHLFQSAWDPLGEPVLYTLRLDVHRGSMFNEHVLWGFVVACSSFLQLLWWRWPEFWSGFSSVATAVLEPVPVTLLTLLRVASYSATWTASSNHWSDCTKKRLCTPWVPGHEKGLLSCGQRVCEQNL